MTKFTILKNNERFRASVNPGENDFFVLITDDGIKGVAIYKKTNACGVITHLDFDFSINEGDRLCDALLRAVILSLVQDMCPYVYYECTQYLMREKLTASVFLPLKKETPEYNGAKLLGLDLENTFFVNGVKLFSSPCRGNEFA